MKRRLINIIISVLFCITIVLTLVSLTLLNKNFIMKVMDKDGYVDTITDNINRELASEKVNYIMKRETVRELVSSYIKSRYKYQKGKYESDTVDEIINKHILFMGNRDYKKIIYLIYMATLAMIVFTGNIFLKSKRVHDLASIFIYSFFIIVVIYGSIYFNLDKGNFIFEGILNTFNHILLGVGIILLEVGVYNKRRFKKLS